MKGDPPWPFRRRLSWIGRNLPWHRPQVRVAAVLGDNANSLQRWDNWVRLQPSLADLVSLLPQKATIRPFIYSRQRSSRPQAFGLLRFSEANNRRWIEALHDPELYLDQLQIWSPARSSTIEKGLCPDFYFQLFSDDLGNEQGVVLAVRLDRLGLLGAAADRLVHDLQAILRPARTLIADRAWPERRIAGLIRVNNLDDRAAFDAFEWAEANPSRQVQAFAAPQPLPRT